MAGWSLSSLANQAEAFLEQVDRQAATSLGEGERATTFLNP